MNHVRRWECLPGRRNSRCRGPKVGGWGLKATVTGMDKGCEMRVRKGGRCQLPSELRCLGLIPRVIGGA